MDEKRRWLDASELLLMTQRRVRNNPTQAKRRLEWATQIFVTDKESTVKVEGDVFHGERLPWVGRKASTPDNFFRHQPARGIPRVDHQL